MRVAGAVLWCLPCIAFATSAGYEEALVQWGLEQSGRDRDPTPEGKRVDELVIISESIVAPTDPYPNWLNVFHARTRESVIRQEVLLPIGSAYQASLAEETERNLRALFVLAIARVVPVRSRAPNTVALLIVTKDLWSIRLNSQFNLVGTLLQYLQIQPTEQNFLGLNKQLSLTFALALDTVSLGETFKDPRVLGTFQSLSEQFAIILNRRTQQPDGATGALSWGLPLYSLESLWGYSVIANWAAQTVRVYRGADVWTPIPFVPDIYSARTLSAEALYTRSYGRALKLNLSVGAGAYSHRYAPPSSESLTAEESQAFAANYLPFSESAVYLKALAQFFEARYAVVHDLTSFALSEDYQLGPSAIWAARWANPIFFSPSRFVESGLSIRYRWLWSDDLLTIEAAGAARYQSSTVGYALSGPWVNRHLAFEINNASPFIAIGRLVIRGLLDVRAADLSHTVVLLGGGDGLRGVAPEALSGRNELLFNVEYRTRPFNFHTLHVGFVAFWDAGSAFDSTAVLVHTVGVGIRALFPQFDIEPVRIDFGYVLNAANPGALQQVSSSFGQVENYRPAFLDNPLP